MKRLLFGLLVAVAGCGAASGGSTGSSDAGSPFIAGFNPPPVAAGYTRYITPVIDNITPGTDTIWCQWVAGPSPSDENVVDVTGMQSKYGHHVALYSSTENEPVGTTRVCTTADMVSVRFLGAIGGEGTGSASALPPGLVLRLPKGQSLLANVHFLNLGQDTIQGQAVVDVKYDTPNANERVAGFFNNTDTQFEVQPNATGSADRTCTVQSDMSFFMFSDHMHNWGTSASTTVTHPDGTVDTIVSDDTWQPEEQFNPTWKRWDVASPFTVHAGDVIKTHCEWNNTTTQPLEFPEEMCIGVGFYVPSPGTDGQDIYCVDGTWSVGGPPS